jgi:hypothetical protein
MLLPWILLWYQVMLPPWLYALWEPAYLGVESVYLEEPE